VITREEQKHYDRLRIERLLETRDAAYHSRNDGWMVLIGILIIMAIVLADSDFISMVRSITW